MLKGRGTFLITGFFASAKVFASLLSVLALAGCASTPVARAPATAVIEYDALKASAVTREVRWQNPDGTLESLRLIELAIPSANAGVNAGTVSADALVDDYLQKVYGKHFSPEMREVRPLMVVLHSMAVGTLQMGLEKSGFLDDEVGYGISKWGRLPVGAHFIIDRDGAIYCLAPPRNLKGEINYDLGSRFPLKRHVIEANPWAIGIENIAPENLNWTELPEKEKRMAFSDLTSPQVEASARLVRWLSSSFPAIKSVFSHDQFMNPEFRSALSESILPFSVNPNYTTKSRYDTGPDFLQAVLRKASVHGHRLTSEVLPR